MRLLLLTYTTLWMRSSGKFCLTHHIGAVFDNWLKVVLCGGEEQPDEPNVEPDHESSPEADLLETR